MLVLVSTLLLSVDPDFGSSVIQYMGIPAEDVISKQYAVKIYPECLWERRFLDVYAPYGACKDGLQAESTRLSCAACRFSQAPRTYGPQGRGRIGLSISHSNLSLLSVRFENLSLRVSSGE